MAITTSVFITIIAIIFSGFFSGTEIAFVQSNKVKLEIDASKGGLINRIINGFNKNQDMFISTLLVGNNIVLVIYGIAISNILNEPILRNIYDNEAFILILNTLISTTIILITGEFLPKTIFRINPNGMLKAFALPAYIIYMVLYPISLLTSWISRSLMKLVGIKNKVEETGTITIDELDDYIQQSIEKQKDRDDVENEVKIFKNAIDFVDTHIHDCMIPRNEIIAVNIDATSREQLLQMFISTGLSKIVVFRDDIDNILGYIHISEMFDEASDWKENIKPVIFTPETMLANKMMNRLMSERRSMAIVIDEFGGTSGLVTLEDLVEEIFGEIEDEHDRQKLIARKMPDASFEFSGRMEIERINEEFGFDLKESDEYHTLAGYILVNQGVLPMQGDSFDVDGLHFTILKMSETKIELIKVTPSLNEDR